ncbi:MAG: cache domain-containing protein [Thermoproteota archaeon]|nr:cache domain-containing protein [Thermoproteota archaeon]
MAKYLFFGREKEIGIILIISIIISSNGLLFFIQNAIEVDLRRTTFEQQRDLQLQSTKEIAQHIESDIRLVLSMLNGLANSLYLQQGELGSERTTTLLEQTYANSNLTIDSLFVLNDDDIMVASLASKPSEFVVGDDFWLRSWVKETRDSLDPIFSAYFQRLGIYREFITYPIISRETREYFGMLVTSIPTILFFSHYGKFEHTDTQFLVAFDKNGTILAACANINLVGANFFGEDVQKFVNHNEILNDLTRDLLSGKSGYGVYDYGEGERLTTQYPVFVNGRPEFFIQIVTPTSEIYTKINEVLAIQQVKVLPIIVVASTIAIAVLVILLKKWNIILVREVKRRTQELEDSYEQMKNYIEQVQAELQKEKLKKSHSTA